MQHATFFPCIEPSAFAEQMRTFDRMRETEATFRPRSAPAAPSNYPKHIDLRSMRRSP